MPTSSATEAGLLTGGPFAEKLDGLQPPENPRDENALRLFVKTLLRKTHLFVLELSLCILLCNK